MYNKISPSCPDFKNLNLNQKLNWLLNVEDVEIILSVCNLIDKRVEYTAKFSTSDKRMVCWCM